MADLQTQFKDGWKSILGRWENFDRGTQMGIAAGLLILIVAGGVFFSNLANPSYEVLFANLEEGDSAEVVASLDKQKIPYRFDEDNNNAILVPADVVHKTRLSLTAEGLPNGAGVGFEIFDDQKFGESEFYEQIKYHRALEGELSRTISHLDGVDAARVHLVMPKRTLFSVRQPPATASVVLKLKPGWKMREDRVGGVINLVASSVRGLDPANVTVVDGQGRNLSDGQASDEKVAEDALQYRRKLEKDHEQAIQKILDTTLGTGRSMVKVTADLNFAKEELTQESFDPDRVATRSQQLTTQTDTAEGPALNGVPGATTNLPGGAANAQQATNSTRSNSEGRTETTNYEITKEVRHIIEPTGRVKQLRVVVVADGDWKTTKKGKRKFTPLKQEDLARIRTIVETAAGIQANRGDTVTVECVPFAASAIPPESLEVDPWEEYEQYLPQVYIGAGVLALLLTLWAIFAMRKQFRNRTQRIEQEAEEVKVTMLPTAPTTVRELEENLQESTTELREQAALAQRTAEDTEAAAAARAFALELATQDPEAAARIVRGWINESAGDLEHMEEEEKKSA